MQARTHKRFESGNILWAETVLSEQVKVKNRIKNISMSGICLETSQQLAHDDVYTIEIGSSSKEKIMPAAKVVWSALRSTVKENNNVIPLYEVGLKFVNMDDKEKFSLHNLLIKLVH